MAIILKESTISKASFGYLSSFWGMFWSATSQRWLFYAFLVKIIEPYKWVLLGWSSTPYDGDGHPTFKWSESIWMFPKIVVPPNHPILIGFSIINHPFWGSPIFGNTHILWMCKPPTDLGWWPSRSSYGNHGSWKRHKNPMTPHSSDRSWPGGSRRGIDVTMSR